MILCKNGHPNPEGSTYCSVCKVYIDASAPHVESAPQPTPVAPPPPPPPAPASPEVSLSETSLAAAPGGEASCEVRVHNPGALADEYTVEVMGQAAAWAVVEPWHLSIGPGGAATAWAKFRPDPGATAGTAVPFEVNVTPKLLLDHPVSVLGVLQVTGTTEPVPPTPAPPEPPTPTPVPPAPVTPPVPAATSSGQKPKRHVVRKVFGVLMLIIAIAIVVWKLAALVTIV
jgi:hypothetical protein